MSTAGLVLAAGGGRRMGGPKALLATDGEAWVARAVSVLAAGGCDPVVVTLGAQASAARPLVPAQALVVEVAGWERGMGESLRQGLEAVERLAPGAQAVVVTLVDLPGLHHEAVARVVRAGGDAPAAALCQARYDGRPGHPVLLGRAHWARLRAGLAGDAGARDHLSAHGAVAVDCTDLGGGDDVDTPALIDESR